MARDYKHKANPRSKNDSVGSALSFFTGLSIGLFVALVVYLYEHDPIEVSVDTEPDVAAGRDTAPAPRRPHFDFYAILPEVEVKVPDWIFSETGEAQTDDGAPEVGAFLLQAGAFRSHEDADRAKAKLALLGISADIQRVILNGQDVWFRVLIGPFDDVADFDTARQRLVDNDFPYIVHRAKAAQDEST
jgi:hypothetical protein